MLIRFIAIIFILSLVFTNRGWSTEPTTVFPVAVENPSYYVDLVSSSPIPELFPGCSLAEPGNPRYFKEKPESVYLKQVYLTPEENSEFGVHYRLQVKIGIDHDTITGLIQLKEKLEDYKERISKFESYPVIRKFLEVNQPDEMNYDGTRFYCDVYSENQINFDLDSVYFKTMYFHQPELISNICLFLPELDSMGWFHEFRDKAGIGSVTVEKNVATISQNPTCPSCLNNVTYFRSNSCLVGFGLDANYQWTDFPMIAYVRQVVKEHLTEDSLGSCDIGSGRGHTYLILSHYVAHGDQLEETWNVKVAIKCQEGPSWRDVCFRILSDSNIDRFRECYSN